MSDLVGNPEDRFSRDEALFMVVLVTCKFDDDTDSCIHDVFSIISLWDKFSALKGK